MAGIFDMVTPEDIEKLRAQQQQVAARNMKQVGPAMREIFGERVPNAALEGPAAEAGGAAAKRGLLSKFLSAAGGPVSTGAQAALYSPTLNDGEDAVVDENNSKERIAGMNADPESAMNAARFGNDVAQRTLDAGMQRTTPSPMAMQQPAQPQAAPQQDPEAVAQQVEQEKQQTEAKRQVVERGAVEALRTNQVSRPQLAEEVVKSDLARKGETATPDELKQLVQKETVEMRTMDNKDLSKYVSYALIAGGIAAAFMDKSGKAGDAFSAGFNKQLDRNLVQQKMKAAQQQQEVENKLNTYKIGQTDRKISIDDRNADTNEAKAQGVLGNYDTQAALGKERNDIARLNVNASMSNAAATQGLRREQMDLNKGLFDLRKSNSDRDYELNARKTDAAEQRAANSGGLKAPMLSSTAALNLVTERAKENGVPLSKGAAPQVAEALRILIKDDPAGYATNPQKFYDTAILSSNLKQEGNTNWYNNRKLRIKKPEDE